MNEIKEFNVDALFQKYDSELESKEGLEVATVWNSQYDDYSAAINYCVVRELKPKVVVEFGARTGRCAYDIVRALIKNGGKYLFKTYEIEEPLRATAQDNLNKKISNNKLVIGGDILQDKKLPGNIEYLFVDNSHDGPTTDWLFDTLLPRCVFGAIVQIHDVPLVGDFVKKKGGVFPETDIIIKKHLEGTLPLEKLYWASEDTSWESSWWIYKSI